VKTGRPAAKLAKRLVATQQGYAIHTVSSFAVRGLTAPDEEFTNFAIHGDFPDLIPEREIWIDERLFDDEGIFYLANALVRLKVQRDRGSEGRAYAAGLDVERALREWLVGVKFRAGRPHKRVPRRIYVGHYLTRRAQSRSGSWTATWSAASTRPTTPRGATVKSTRGCRRGRSG